MKLKKLLAAVTAAALAVTTMAVTSFTASAAAKDPVEITLYDSSTAPAGDDCGSGGKNYSVSSSQLSSWGVDADGLSSCYVIVTYAEAPTSGVIGINANNANGLVDWNANFSYVDNISGTTTSTVALSSVGDKAATVIANGLTVQVKSAYVSKIDFNTGSSSENIFTYTAGAVSEIEFNAAAMAALEGASGISAQITGTGSGYGYFTEMSSWNSTEGGNPATLTNENEKWDTFAAASGIKIVFGGFDSISKVVLTITYPEESEDNGEFEISITPETKTIAVDEDFTVTVLVTGTTPELQNVDGSTQATYDAAIVSVDNGTDTDDGMVYTITGVAAGTTTVNFEWTPDESTGIELKTPVIASCEVTVTDGTTPPAIDTSGWQAAFNGFTGDWGGWQGSASEEGTLTHTCTVKDVMDANGMTSIDELGGILAQVWNASVGDRVAYAIRIESADGTIKDVRSGIYTVALGSNGDPDGTFKQYQTAATDGDFVFAPTDVLKIAIAAGETVPTIPDDEPDDPTPPVTGNALWEGTQDFGNWADTPVEIAAEKFSGVNAGDTIKFTYTINAVPGEAWNQIKIADNDDTVLASPTGQNEWNCIDLSSTTTYSFEISAADLALVKANGMKITGHGVVLKKVECVAAGGDTPVPPEHTHTPATAWSSDATGHWHACSGCDEKLSFAAHTSDTGTVTTPATETTSGTRIYKCTVCEYVIRTETIPATGSSSVYPPAYTVGAPIIPVGSNGSNAPTVNGQSGWEAVSAEIVTSSDGGKIVVNMNSATKVPSTILGDIEGKDVDLVLNMGRGITWTINGLSVTSRKTIDLDISKNTRHIPDEVVDKAEGSHKKQFSLDHKGNFGCTAALTYDVGTRYNGLYANLFYYNPKTEQLEFADCSLISGGNAKFMFTHASDYLITISDEPLGEFEDVSSAAGIVSDNGVIGNGAAISAVLAVIVLGFGIVVYRKRRHN